MQIVLPMIAGGVAFLLLYGLFNLVTGWLTEWVDGRARRYYEGYWKTYNEQTRQMAYSDRADLCRLASRAERCRTSLEDLDLRVLALEDAKPATRERWNEP